MSEPSPFEQQMIGILESEREPSVTDFGSFDDLIDSSQELGESPLLPEFIRMMLQSDHWQFVLSSLPFCTNGTALVEIVDLLDPVPIERVADIFRIYIRKFSEAKNSTVARCAALDGAFRMVSYNDALRFELISCLLSVGKDEDPKLLRSVAKITGVAHAHWGVSELFDLLVRFSEADDAIDQVAFEIGSCKMRFALEANNANSIEREFFDARYWFERSLAADANRHDAAIYLACVDSLVCFHHGELIDATKLAAELRNLITLFTAWNQYAAGPNWLIGETTKIFLWDTLAAKLIRLNDELVQPSWFETAVVVEQYLAAVWTASMTILRRDQETGIEQLVRPRIEGTIAATHGQSHAVKQWLRRNQDHEERLTIL